jgi:hypothetical protein
MGSVLAPKSTVETEPASTATPDMHKKLGTVGRFVRRARHPFLEVRPMGGFTYNRRLGQPPQATLH